MPVPDGSQLYPYSPPEGYGHCVYVRDGDYFNYFCFLPGDNTDPQFVAAQQVSKGLRYDFGGGSGNGTSADRAAPGSLFGSSMVTGENFQVPGLGTAPLPKPVLTLILIAAGVLAAWLAYEFVKSETATPRRLAHAGAKAVKAARGS